MPLLELPSHPLHHHHHHHHLYLCHGVGPPVDLFQSHVSRSLFRGPKVCHDSFCQMGNSVSLPRGNLLRGILFMFGLSCCSFPTIFLTKIHYVLPTPDITAQTLLHSLHRSQHSLPDRNLNCSVASSFVGTDTYFGAGSPSASHSMMKGLSFSFCCCAT